MFSYPAQNLPPPRHRSTAWELVIALLKILQCFEQEPGAALSLVNPVLNEARSCDVIVFLADLMRGTQESRQLSVVAAKFLEANTPVIAIEVPHPGATYFGANNYKAGLIAGRALGRWTREHWKYKLDQVLLLELPIAGSLVELRITGFADGLRSELPEVGNLPAVHLNGRGDFEQVLETMRQFLRRARAKRTLIGTVNDVCALAALRAFEEVGATDKIAIASQNCLPEVRAELRRPNTPLIGTVAYFPELYGEEIIPLALGILAKKTLAPAVFVKHQLVTPRNVDLIYPLDERTAAIRANGPSLRTVA